MDWPCGAVRVAQVEGLPHRTRQDGPLGRRHPHVVRSVWSGGPGGRPDRRVPERRIHVRPVAADPPGRDAAGPREHGPVVRADDSLPRVRLQRHARDAPDPGVRDGTSPVHHHIPGNPRRHSRGRTGPDSPLTRNPRRQPPLRPADRRGRPPLPGLRGTRASRTTPFPATGHGPTERVPSTRSTTPRWPWKR